MIGLTRTDAASASLMLTLEGVATALLAWFVLHENFDRRIALGMVCLVAGAVVLSWSGTPSLSGLLGPFAIIGACLAWGLDYNLTRKVSLADPLQIVELKSFIAGPVNLALGGSVRSVFGSAISGGVFNRETLHCQAANRRTGFTRLASTLSMRRPSRSTTSKRQPLASTRSPVFGMCWRRASTKPATVS